MLFLFFSITLSAKPLDLSVNNDNAFVLENSELFLSDKPLSLQELLENKLFKPYGHHYINTGMLAKTIWITFELQNKSRKTIEKSLILTSALLEHIALYSEDYLDKPILKGVSHMEKEHHTLFPFYVIKLNAGESKRYYLEVNSKLTPVDFTLKLDDKEHFFERDQFQQFINILLIGFVFALALYSFILFFYTKDQSYFYYSLYLFALICQQMTYLGLTQIYFPLEIIAIDMQIPVLKVNILVITAALFAIHFLKIEQFRLLHTIYKGFIAVSLIEIVLLSSSSYYNLYIVIFTGALFIIFNLFAGIYSYRKGHTQARLFIVGFGIVFVSYMMIILDAIAVTSIMQDFQNILMFGTAFEALVLSLAFADRYLILQRSKKRLDGQLLKESLEREEIIMQTVEQKTKKLNEILKEKELLLREIRHRVKNNLQIIISMIRMQNDASSDSAVHETLEKLENRVNAISKTYSMLLTNDAIQEIDMKRYIDELLKDLMDSMGDREHKQIEISSSIHAKLPLKKAVYVGLIINELLTNAYKHAFPTGRGKVSLYLNEEKGEYLLKFNDNGIGYDTKTSTNSFGLKLINIIVKHQLKGSIIVETQPHCEYTIRFSL